MKILPPSMQYSCDSRHCAEIFQICTQLQYRFGCRLKQQRVHDALLLPKNRIQFGWNGENNMEIWYVE